MCIRDSGRNLEHPMTFAQLLQEIEKIEGLERIRFMTSHPKDLSDELIEVMKNSKKNLQSPSFAIAVWKQPHFKNHEPSL